MEIFIFSIKVRKIVFLEKFKLEIRYLERSILGPIFIKLEKSKIVGKILM